MESYNLKNHDYKIKRSKQIGSLLGLLGIVLAVAFVAYAKNMINGQYRNKEENLEDSEDTSEEDDVISISNNDLEHTDYKSRRGYTRIHTELSN